MGHQPESALTEAHVEAMTPSGNHRNGDSSSDGRSARPATGSEVREAVALWGQGLTGLPSCRP